MKIQRPDIPNELKRVTGLAGLLGEDAVLSGLLVEQTEADGVRAKGADIQESRLIKCHISQAAIEKLHVRDCVLDGCDLTASSFPDSSWHAVEVINARCSGIQLQMNTLKNVLFKNCKLDLANFRFAKLENVIFDSCTITEMDFYSARLKNVVFIQSPLEDVTFSDAVLKNVDISASPIIRIKGLRGLKGALINPEQLMQLAPYFAQEVGIIVKDS